VVESPPIVIELSVERLSFELVADRWVDVDKISLEVPTAEVSDPVFVIDVISEDVPGMEIIPVDVP